MKGDPPISANILNYAPAAPGRVHIAARSAVAFAGGMLLSSVGLSYVDQVVAIWVPAWPREPDSLMFVTGAAAFLAVLQGAIFGNALALFAAMSRRPLRATTWLPYAVAGALLPVTLFALSCYRKVAGTARPDAVARAAVRFFVFMYPAGVALWGTMRNRTRVDR